MDPADLWDASGELKYALLDPSEADAHHDHFAARQALMSSWALDADVERDRKLLNDSSDWVLVREGCARALKFKVGLNGDGRRLHRVYRDVVVLWVPRDKSSAMQAAMDGGERVFVMAVIFTGTAMDLPLGRFTVARREGSGFWRLAASEQEAVSEGSAREEVAAPVAESVPNAEPEASEEEGPPRRRARHAEGERQQSLQFMVGHDSFDSMLECVHKQAFDAMQLPYFVARSQFDLVAVLPSHRCYTPDGQLYVRIGCPEAPPRVAYVEIKPGPLTLAEHELCYALCQAHRQPVLCVMGGMMERGSAPEERERPFVEMALYEPTAGSIHEVEYHPQVLWRWSSVALEPYLAKAGAADPRQRQLEQQRLRALYAEATFSARRLAGPALDRLRKRARE